MPSYTTINNQRVELTDWHEENCPYCKKTFECQYEEQEPGFRWTETLVCPYCGKIIQESMEYDFYVRKFVKGE